jgi:hypothetical protein
MAKDKALEKLLKELEVKMAQEPDKEKAQEILNKVEELKKTLGLE